MTTSGERIAEAFAGIPSLSIQTGIFVEMVGALARVRMSDTNVDLPMVGAMPYRVGATVQVLWANGTGVVLGHAVPRSPFGTVVEVNPPYATVTVAGELFELPYRTGSAPVVGNLVEINWATNIIGGAISALPQEQAIPPLPEVLPTEIEYLIRATSSYWYGTKWTEGTVRAADGITSVWTYGDAAVGLLDDVTVTSVEVYMPLESGGAGVSIGTHGYAGAPTGAPSLGNATAIADPSGWVSLPLTFAPLFAVGGVGVTATGAEARWSSVAEDPSSGAVRFRGTIEGAN